ncbi:MAG: hypothetical protein ACRD12_09915 [Acidimicrobiales bacterium]
MIQERTQRIAGRRARTKRIVALLAATLAAAAGLALGQAPADASALAWASNGGGYAGFWNNPDASEVVYVCDNAPDGLRAIARFAFPGSTGEALHAAGGYGTCASRTPGVPEGSQIWAQVCLRNGQYGADQYCGNWTLLGWA